MQKYDMRKGEGQGQGNGNGKKEEEGEQEGEEEDGTVPEGYHNIGDGDSEDNNLNSDNDD